MTDTGPVETPRVGLALAGGGARGLAQVGVLRVLEREGVPVHLVAGTSIGAIIGGLYAMLGTAAAVESRVRAILGSERMSGLELGRVLQLSGIMPVDDDGTARDGLWGRLRRRLRRLSAAHAALTRSAVLPGEAVLEVFRELFEDCTFEEANIPFRAVAVDLDSGREVTIGSGRIAPAVAASSAVAGIFPPVEIAGRRLIDGGYTSPVPVDAVRTMGADVVVAVDVSAGNLDREGVDNAVEVAMRSSEICLVALEREQLRRADVAIRAAGRPRHWSDYSQPEEAIEAGAAAAEQMLGVIRKVLEARHSVRL